MWGLPRPGIEPVSSALAGGFFNHWTTGELQCFTFKFEFSFVLYVLFSDNEVYAWGNNSMGQCGQGNSTGPITKPKKVSGLDGIAIQQISAGTSHSLAWTALPRDR